MKEILDKLNNIFSIPCDKLSHYFYGQLFYFVFQFLFTPIMAIVMVWLVGMVKEIIDTTIRKRDPEILDMVFTLAGALSVALLIAYGG